MLLSFFQALSESTESGALFAEGSLIHPEGVTAREILKVFSPNDWKVKNLESADAETISLYLEHRASMETSGTSHDDGQGVASYLATRAESLVTAQLPYSTWVQSAKTAKSRAPNDPYQRQMTSIRSVTKSLLSTTNAKGSNVSLSAPGSAQATLPHTQSTDNQ